MFILVNNEEGMEPYLEGRLNWTQYVRAGMQDQWNVRNKVGGRDWETQRLTISRLEIPEGVDLWMKVIYLKRCM